MSIGRLAPALAGERLVQFLQAAVEALKSSTFGAVQVGACRAVASLVPRAPGSALQPLLDPIYEGMPPRPAPSPVSIAMITASPPRDEQLHVILILHGIITDLERYQSLSRIVVFILTYLEWINILLLHDTIVKFLTSGVDEVSR